MCLAWHGNAKQKLAGKSEAQANAMAHAVVGIMWWTAVGIMDDFQKTAVADRFEKDRSRRPL
jgi:hypothetical protein